MSLTKASYSMITGAFVNVLDYGADSTGVVDSTTAIQDAVDFAAPIGRTVFIPAGTYKIGAITLPQQHGGIEIVGEAYDSMYNLENSIYRGTVLVSTLTTGNIISCDGGVYYSNRGIRIRRLNIKSQTTGYAIYLNGAPEGTLIEDCCIYSGSASAGNGIGLVNCWGHVVINRCLVTNKTVSGFNSKGLYLYNDIKAGGVNIQNSAFSGFYQNAYVGDRVYQASFRNVGLETGVFGFWIEGADSTVLLDTCHFEFNIDRSISLMKSQSFVAQNCSFYRNAETASTIKAEIYISGGGSDYNGTTQIQNCQFMGIGTDVTSVYAVNTAFLAAIDISNNKFVGFGTNTKGIYVSGSDLQKVQAVNNAFFSVTTPYDPSTLNSYQEGTWALADNSGASLTFTSISANYTKIGRIVTAVTTFTFPSTASGLAATINLPFAASKISVGSCTSSSGSPVSLKILSDGSNLAAFYSAAGSQLTNANLSGATVTITLTYFI